MRICVISTSPFDPRMRKRLIWLSDISEEIYICCGDDFKLASDVKFQNNYPSIKLKDLVKRIQEFDLIYFSSLKAFLSFSFPWKSPKKHTLYLLEIADLPHCKFKYIPLRLKTWLLSRYLADDIDGVVLTSAEYLQFISTRAPTVIIENYPEETIASQLASLKPRPFSEKYILSYIGYIRDIKGLEKIIEWKTDSRCDVEIHIWGGPQENLPSNAYMEGVIYHGSYNYEKDIARIYDHADFIIATYGKAKMQQVAMPNRFYEALLAGKPLIVDSGSVMHALTETLDHGFKIDPEGENFFYEMEEGLGGCISNWNVDLLYAKRNYFLEMARIQKWKFLDFVGNLAP